MDEKTSYEPKADELSALDDEEEEEEEETEEGIEDDTQTTDERVADEAFVRLAAGAPLRASETETIRRHRRTRLVVLAGDGKSGKTTFLASIFLRFQQGPFADYLFAGSHTLMGFEARCWPSRAASLGRKATTIKTPAGSENFYHLSVRKERLDSPTEDLLFADISGEIYRTAVTSSSACLEIEEVRQADHFVLLLDGAKLRSYGQNQVVLSNARQLLRRLLDTGMLPFEASVQIVFTKYDILKAEIHDLENAKILPPGEYFSVDESEEFLKLIETTMLKEFKNRVSQLHFFRVSSRSDFAGYDLASGISPMLELWIEELPERSPSLQFPSSSMAEREENKFLFRELGLDNS